MESKLRCLPSVDSLISHPQLKELEGTYSHSTIVSLVRQYLSEVRISISSGSTCPLFREMIEEIHFRARALQQIGPSPVLNATGVILHTNLGRAPLSQEAITAMRLAATGYSNLELELDSGKRGSRQVHVEPMLCQITSAEAAMVVNNNASAVLLALAALARGKEVIISRGEEVEIGGGFRLPKIIRQSGAKLVEVGTTNRTYLTDYEEAIGPRTAILLKVHPSNFEMLGFTHTVSLSELVNLSHQHGLLVLHDLGSGCFLDTTKFGLTPEPVLQGSIAAGADLAFSSGDKLLGGPQAGIIVGKKALIEKLNKHPLARAMRIDKVGLAGLAATMLHYLKGEAVSKIPVWRMIATSVEEIEKRAEKWTHSLNGLAAVIDGESTIGGGSLPGSTLPTKLVAIKGKTGAEAERIARNLRLQQPPVVGRIDKNAVLLDPRTVLPEDDEVLLRVLGEVLQSNMDK
jgi:seryl-tRNA(sec) selenium transferase